MPKADASCIRSVLCALIILVAAFAVIPRAATALPPGIVQANAPSVGSADSGILLSNQADGSVAAQNLATFQRWDGSWLPQSSLNQSSGDWPYLASDSATNMNISRLGQSFNQGIVTGSIREFLPDRVKETLVVSLMPIDPVVSIPFTTTYSLNVSPGVISLADWAGNIVWRTEPFHAWDSSETPQVWENPVVSIGYVDGQILVALDPTMIASASYPLYVDPTWTLSPALGWGASTFQDAVEDKGDHNIKIGWLADNFNDNINEIWTVEAGSATFTQGVMHLSTSTTVRAGSAWMDYRFALKIRFTQAGGTAQAYARFQNANNHYYLDVSELGDTLTLKKRYLGTLYTVATIPKTIATGVDYTIKLRVSTPPPVSAAYASIEVWWQNQLAWSGLDGTGFGAPASGYIKLVTNSAAKVDIDDVRVWNTALGLMTTAVRNAGAGYHPTQTKTVATVDGYNQTHIRIKSSSDNVIWGPWTNLKADTASAVFYKLPDQDTQRYYQLRVTLTSGNEGTPGLSELTTSEDNLPVVINPTANTGFEPWYPYVGGLVNGVTGNVWYSAKDLSVRARAFDLSIHRSYNSLLGTQTGPLGNGWTFNYNEKLVVNPDTTVTWNDPDGSQHTFTPKGTSGGYSAPRGVTARLVKNADTSFTLWRLDGTRETFDSSGKLTSIAEKNGNKMTLSYVGGTSKLATIADDSGIILVFTYDGSNRITSIKDPINRYVNYSYDGSSNLIQVRDPMGFPENYTYTSNKVASIVDPVGKRTSFVYDGSSRATEIWLGFYQAGRVVWQFRQYSIANYASTTRTLTNARSFTTTITLNSYGNPTNHSGPPIGCGACDSKGNWTAYQWDGEMNKIKITDGRVNTWSQDSDHRSRMLSRTDPGGNISTQAWSESNSATQYVSLLMNRTNFRTYKTSFSYDANGNLLTTTDALGSVSYRTYTSQGFLATSKDYRGYQTNYTYDTHGWLKQFQNPSGYTTTYDYDVIGRRLNVSTPLGFKTNYQYDGLDRLITVTDPLGNQTSYGFNARGDRVRVTDPNNYATLSTINVTSAKISKTTEAGGNFTLSAYDLRGNLVRFTNPNGNATSYGYDGYDRQSQETSSGGNSTSYTYDAGGNMATRTDANGNLTKYGWDNENRLMKVTYPGSVLETAAYDANGNTVHAAGLGYTRDETWDALDRRTSTTYNYESSFSKTVSYQFDVDSHRTRMNYSDGTYLTYTWDLIGRLNKTTFSDGSVWWYEYDHDNRRTKLTEPNNVVTTWVYDGASRLNTTSSKKGATTLESFTYWFDKAGSRVRIVEGDGSWVKYNYDNIYRLVKESYSAGQYTSYDYDQDGSRRHSINATVTTTYSYGKEDQLLQSAVSGGGTTMYVYDKNGNLRSKTVAGSTTTYGYDFENRVASITAGGSTTSFGYSAEGKRMKRVSGGTATYFGYDYAGLSGFDDVIAEFSSIGTVLTIYVHGPRVDEPLGMKQATWSFYERDGLGSVSRLTDGTGGTLATYRYNAFGATRAQTGSSNTYGFTSRENEATLMYYRTRYYDTSAGRFTSSDSAGLCGGYNRYAYVGNNPTNQIDPRGQMFGRYIDGGGGGGGGGGTNPTITSIVLSRDSITVTTTGGPCSCMSVDWGCYFVVIVALVSVLGLNALILIGFPAFFIAPIALDGFLLFNSFSCPLFSGQDAFFRCAFGCTPCTQWIGSGCRG
jgi:RHS repeat-associated protein